MQIEQQTVLRSAAEAMTMKHIYLVEDDPIIIQVYCTALRKRGFLVTVAEDGLVAMKGLSQLCPDLVVLDVMMPKVDGTYVLKYIRSRPELSGTKVIILSNASIADAGSELFGVAGDDGCSILDSGVVGKSSKIPLEERLEYH